MAQGASRPLHAPRCRTWCRARQPDSWRSSSRARGLAPCTLGATGGELGRASPVVGAERGCVGSSDAQKLVRERSRRSEGPSNKRMKLTKLSAAPLRGRRRRLMPAAAGMDAGTASQLIPGVRRTICGRAQEREAGKPCGRLARRRGRVGQGSCRATECSAGRAMAQGASRPLHAPRCWARCGRASPIRGVAPRELAGWRLARLGLREESWGAPARSLGRSEAVWGAALRRSWCANGHAGVRGRRTSA